MVNGSNRLPENAHLPFDMLTALSKAEGLRYPHPSSLRRTFRYDSFLGISEALHLGIFMQSLEIGLLDSLVSDFSLKFVRKIWWEHGKGSFRDSPLRGI